MAIHFGRGYTNAYNQWVPGNGNGSAVIGGQWNPQTRPPPYAWGNPLSGATALTVVLSIKPDPAGNFYTVGMPGSVVVPYQGDWTGGYTGGYYYGALASQNGQYAGMATFMAGLAHGSQTNLWFRVIDYGPYDARTATTTNGPLLYDAWNRLVFRWRASDQAIEIWHNGVACPVTVVNGPTGNAPSQLTVGSNGGPIEIGAESDLDAVPVQGAYAEAAIWTAYLSDADAAAYGTGTLPPALSQTGIVRYTTLETDLPHWQSDFTNGDWTGTHCGSVTEVIGPHVYGAGESGDRTVNPHKTFLDQSYLPPFGGLPGGQAADSPVGYSVVPGPTETVATPTYLNPDAAALPIEWFELEEINGNCGQRSLTRRRIPQDYATLDAALQAAQYGDDIVIDHTYTGVSINTQKLYTKTFNAATPRMPPHQKRPLTSSRGLTSAR